MSKANLQAWHEYQEYNNHPREHPEPDTTSDEIKQLLELTALLNSSPWVDNTAAIKRLWEHYYNVQG